MYKKDKMYRRICGQTTDIIILSIIDQVNSKTLKKNY